MPTPPHPSPSWVQQLRGRFVVFDGPDGSGKSTQFRRFSAFVADAGVEVCEVREPGGTAVGEEVRRLLLDPANKEELDVRCEMLLFMASRAQLVAQRIQPALSEGKLVLADRFISSTLAYQGAAGGLAADDILRVGRIAIGDCWPDLVVIFDVDEKTAATRLSPLLDRIELKGVEFHRTVRQGYLQQARHDPSRHLIVDAGGSVDMVFQHLLRDLARKLEATAPAVNSHS